MSRDDCFVCSKHRGGGDVPGGVLLADDVVYAGHVALAEPPSTTYLGWVVVEPRRHVTGLAGLSDDEAQAIGLAAARLSRALVDIQGAEHVYAFVLGHAVAHLHLHLIPRYPRTPREYWGVRVNEWPDAPRGGAEAIEALCDRLRNKL